MRIHTPEISWHNREPVFSVDIQKRIEHKDNNKFYRIATCGSDNYVTIWRAYLNNDAIKSKDQAKSTTNNQQKARIDKDIHDLMNNLLDQSVGNHDDEISLLNDEDSLKKKEIKSKDKVKNKRLIELECVSTLTLHIKATNVAKFAPTSNLLASGSDDAYVYIYEFKGTKYVFGFVSSLKFFNLLIFIFFLPSLKVIHQADQIKIVAIRSLILMMQLFQLKVGNALLL